MKTKRKFGHCCGGQAGELVLNLDFSTLGVRTREERNYEVSAMWSQLARQVHACAGAEVGGAAGARNNNIRCRTTTINQNRYNDDARDLRSGWQEVSAQ
jgi:hypothetical protein